MPWLDKRREIFLQHNVRIHLDSVAGLGSFLEFEAVLSPRVDESAGRLQVAQLQRQFALSPEDLLEGSYGEMVAHSDGVDPGAANRGAHDSAR